MRHLTATFALLLIIVSPCRAETADVDVKNSKANQASSQDVNQDAFRDVSSDLRCPTCTGLSVLDSDAPFSVQIKNEVKEQLASGKDKDAILKFFTERYGPWILRAPPKEGVHLLAWLLPFGALLIGPLLIWLFFWARRSKQSETEVVARPVDEIVVEMHSRLDEMRRSDGDIA
jgi:cytochrome c-type biogenesis protein CcmH/NrfF